MHCAHVQTARLTLRNAQQPRVMAESELLSLSPFPNEVSDTIGPDVGTSVFWRSTATIPLKTMYKPLYSFNTTIVDIFPHFFCPCVL